jgi:hypothetical protein
MTETVNEGFNFFRQEKEEIKKLVAKKQGTIPMAATHGESLSSIFNPLFVRLQEIGRANVNKTQREEK